VILRVALFKSREDGTGRIEIYEVDEEEFNNLLTEIYPSCDDDWWYIAKCVEENGKLLQTIKPDYSIYLTQI